MNGEQGRQPSLKPQDVAVLFALHLLRDQRFTFASLASKVGLSVGETHSAVKRAALSRLVLLPSTSSPELISGAVKEFLIHGVRYAFPAVQGAPTRGLPTSLAATSAFGAVDEEALPPVWPTAEGAQKGFSLVPLYPAAPRVCSTDPELHELLALVDAIRVGSARERDIAATLLEDRLS